MEEWRLAAHHGFVVIQNRLCEDGGGSELGRRDRRVRLALAIGDDLLRGGLVRDEELILLDEQALQDEDLRIRRPATGDRPEELAEITVMAAETVRRFGIEPKVALLSHSNFGSSKSAAACKMRQTLELVRQRAPELMIDGEMHGDAALVESIRNERMPDSPLKGSANVLIMPNVEAARISYNLLRVSSSEGVTVGPVLMGVAKPVHVLTPIASVRRIVNMVALAVVEAQTQPL